MKLSQAIFGILIVTTQSAFAQIAECDLLASSPLDPQKQSTGVSFNKLDHVAAVAACKVAVTENKQAPRLWFQYGRALEKANKLPDAIIAYQEAAKLGSGAAHNNMGELYRDGKGFEVNLKMAEDFFKKASDLNSSEGKDNLLKLQGKNKPTTTNQSTLVLAAANNEKLKNEQAENSARNSSKENIRSTDKNKVSASSELKVGIQCIQKYDSNPGRFSLYITDKNGFYVWSSGDILPLSNIRFSDEYLTFEQPVYVSSKRYPEAYAKFRVNRNTLDADSRFEVKLSGNPMVTANDYSCKLIDKEQAYTRYLEVNRQHDEFIKNYDAKTKNEKESQLQNRKF
jgi:hypothetical protein